MGDNVNTKPSVKKVMKWPKIDFLNFFVKAKELIAERLGKGQKPYIPEVENIGRTVIKRDDYTRLNINKFKKLEKFAQPSVVTSMEVKNNLNEKFIEKYPNSDER